MIRTGNRETRQTKQTVTWEARATRKQMTTSTLQTQTTIRATERRLHRGIQKVQAQVTDHSNRQEKLATTVSGDVKSAASTSTDAINRETRRRHMETRQTVRTEGKKTRHEINKSVNGAVKELKTKDVTKKENRKRHIETKQTVKSEGRKTRSEIKKLSRLATEKEVTTKGEDVSNPELKGLIEITEQTIKYHRDNNRYIRSSAFKTGLNSLRKQSMLVLTAPPGFGKTATSIEILSEVRGESDILTVQFHTPSEWTLINSMKSSCMVAFIDDIFGAANYDASLVEMWKPYLDGMFACAKAGRVMLVIATRAHILSEAMKKIKDCPLFNPKYKLDLGLTSNEMSPDEKTKLLINNAHLCDLVTLCDDVDDGTRGTKQPDEERICISQETLIEIVKTAGQHKDSDLPLGFPQCAKIYFSSKHIINKGPLFFTKPLEYLIAEIKLMEDNDKVKYLTLILALIKGGTLYADELENDDELLENISKDYGMSPVLNTSDVLRAAEHLSFVFFRKDSDENAFKISHESVFESLSVVFGERSPALLIRNCSRHVLCDLIRTSSYRPKPGEIIVKIRPKFYQDLADRWLDEVIQGHVWKLSKHQCLSDSSFLQVLFSDERYPRMRKALLAEENGSIWDGQSLIVGAVTHDKQYLDFFKHLTKSRLLIPDVPQNAKWITEQLQDVFKWACYRGHTDICQHLLESSHVKIRNENLIGTCSRGCLEVVQLLVKIWPDTSDWRNVTYGLGTPLLTAACYDQCELVRWLLQENCPVTDTDCWGNSILHYLALFGHTDLVDIVMRKSEGDVNTSIHQSNKYGWSPLHAASFTGRLDIVGVLLGTSTDTDANVRTKDGKTPLELCQEGKAFHDRRVDVKEIIEEETSAKPLFGSDDSFDAIIGMLSNRENMSKPHSKTNYAEQPTV